MLFVGWRFGWFVMFGCCYLSLDILFAVGCWLVGFDLWFATLWFVGFVSCLFCFNWFGEFTFCIGFCGFWIVCVVC